MKKLGIICALLLITAVAAMAQDAVDLFSDIDAVALSGEEMKAVVGGGRILGIMAILLMPHYKKLLLQEKKNIRQLNGKLMRQGLVLVRDMKIAISEKH